MQHAVREGARLERVEDKTGPSEFKAGGICDWLALVMSGGLIWEQERASGNLLYAC